jgi:hypothetical protein
LWWISQADLAEAVSLSTHRLVPPSITCQSHIESNRQRNTQQRPRELALKYLAHTRYKYRAHIWGSGYSRIRPRVRLEISVTLCSGLLPLSHLINKKRSTPSNPPIAFILSVSLKTTFLEFSYTDCRSMARTTAASTSIRATTTSVPQSTPHRISGELESTDEGEPFLLLKDKIASRVLLPNANAPGSSSGKVSRVEEDDDSAELAEDLEEFSSYLASEVWASLPDELKTATYLSMPLGLTYDDLDSLDPTSLSLPTLSPEIVDTLASYGYALDQDDALHWIQVTVRDYLKDVCEEPKEVNWKATRKDVEACEICERDGEEIKLTYHHLIPRSVHAKVLKRGWHEERMLNSVAWLCR